ncbi:60S ribosomal L12 [Brachionus plicatilis]|uniref:60S ribosomal L12 n=1 Tax=Brachionus plicatilis TaxID=10195 RepID=A0A3M7T0B5_BRAPC|nr:60S ribosomal L12 [Brachionus plicatilis]
MFFTFFLSLGASFKALMTKEDADGTTEILACLFWMVNLTVIRRPFQSPVFLAISSEIFFGARPNGPILGARAAVAAPSPPVTLKIFFVGSVELQIDLGKYSLYFLLLTFSKGINFFIGDKNT